VFEPTSVKANPAPSLFNANAASLDARGQQFRDDFPSLMPSLLPDDMSLIALDNPDVFNAGQSTSSDPSEDYVTQAIFGLTEGTSQLTTDIHNTLSDIGRTDLAPFDVVQRAMTQSCAGCHQLAPGIALSGDGTSGPVWPLVRPGGFVHIDEQGFLSPALWCTFLPHRKSVLDGFAHSPAQACTGTAPNKVVARRAAGQTGNAPVTVAGKPFGPN
jgi:hypothetical protein